jgi:hypothetical protein
MWAMCEQTLQKDDEKGEDLRGVPFAVTFRPGERREGLLNVHSFVRCSLANNRRRYGPLTGRVSGQSPMQIRCLDALIRLLLSLMR